jgi:hypothetical protein
MDALQFNISICNRQRKGFYRWANSRVAILRPSINGEAKKMLENIGGYF